MAIVIGLSALVIAICIRFGWQRLLVEEKSPIWSWAERASWLTAVAGVVIAFLALSQGRRTSSSLTEPEPAEPENAARALRLPVDNRFKDRGEEVRLLLEALNDESTNLVFVTGVPGIGKTRLVRRVLDGLPQFRKWHEATPQTRPDVKVLVDDIEEAAGMAPADLRPDESVLARLELAVEALGDRSVIIVLDSAEHLMQGGELDVEFDEAFEVLMQRPQHRVKVVVISHRRPTPTKGSSWGSHAATGRSARVGVSGLPRMYFEELLVDLAGGRSTGPASLGKEVRATLYDSLHGNPRYAELFHAICVAETGPEAAQLLPELADVSANELDERLTTMLLANLSELQRCVVHALAAFATPVRVADLAELVGPEATASGVFTESAVRRAVDALYRGHVVRRGDGGLYYLPLADVERFASVLRSGAEHWTNLLLRAVTILTCRRVAADRIGRVEDLHVHFAELHALIRAEEFDAAFGLVRSIDAVLGKWNAGFLLLQQREQMAERLTDPDLKMANYNRIGYLHRLRGDRKEAGDAYGRALRYAAGDEHVLMKIYGNLAGMYLADGDATRAYGYFDLATRHTDPGVLSGALEGLARCHRLWGAYGPAIVRAREALDGAKSADSPRVVHIAVRVARWSSELGNNVDALKAMEDARLAVERHRDRSLRAVYLDAQAELLLEDAPDEAASVARRAVSIALPMRDPVTLLQARTTLCIAHLRLGDLRAARREVEFAIRYRDRYQSLVVLALQAVVAQQQGDAGTAREGFGRLLDEAATRIDRDARDFGARDMLGLAICGAKLNGTDPLDDAVAAFRRARSDTDLPTPKLITQLRLLLERLDERAARPGRLTPVLELMRSDRTEPERT